MCITKEFYIYTLVQFGAVAFHSPVSVHVLTSFPLVNS